MVKATRILRETTYLIHSLHNVDFRGLVDKHRPRPERLLLEFVDFLIRNLSYNNLCCHEAVNLQYNVLTLGGMADADAIEMRVRRKAHGHLFRSALQFGQLYRMLSVS